MKRLGALLAAAALIVGALLARRAIDGEELPTLRPRTVQQVDCDSAVTAFCEGLDERSFAISALDPASQAEQLASGSPEAFAGWIAAGPWPQMVNSARGTKGDAPVFEPNAKEIATTPIVLVGKTDRLAVLETHCGTITLACIAKVADRPWTSIGGDQRWGSIIYGQDGFTTSFGLGCLLEFARSYFPNRSIASNDFADDPSFADDLANLLGSVRNFDPVSGSNLREFLTKPASASVVCTSEAEAAGAVSRSRDAASLRTVYPDGTTVLGLQVARTTGTAADGTEPIDLGADTAQRLVEVGFRVDGRKPDGAANVAVAKAATLPSAGVINALVALADEVSK